MTCRFIEKLANEIAANLHHGECLYEKDMFDNLIKDIDKLKSFCTIEFNNNQEEAEVEIIQCMIHKIDKETYRQNIEPYTESECVINSKGLFFIKNNECLFIGNIGDLK